VRVVVAEKPSVARDLARVLGASQRRDGHLLGDGLAITWCFGHMAELQEPAHYDRRWKRWSLEALPMLPERFEIKLRADVGDQFQVIERLLRQAEGVVNACDAGREGELIFRWVYELAGATAPVQRLWVSSLTDQAIRAGWSRLRPGRDFDRLADAARSRSEADWLVGLNATRALTCRGRDEGGGQLLSVGRVQTPTLAMIVGRDRAIEAFVPETFWQVKVTFEADVPDELRTFEATWFRAGVREKRRAKGARKEVDRAERLADEPTARAILDATLGQQGRVVTADRKRVTDRPPLLYDLTSLQRRANQRYGLSADRTLAIAQALYEKHKLITYPRTDARYLTPDQVPLLPQVVKGLQPIPPYAPHAAAILARPIQPGKRVVNAAEVGDHHAILPTGTTPRSSGLSADEKRVFDLVARRLLAALSDDALFDVTKLVVHVDPAGPLPDDVPVPLTYRAKGRVCRREGWRAVDPPKKRKEVELPAVDPDDVVQATEGRAPEGQTRPPRPHDDASLLKSMETAGRDLDDREVARAMRGSGLGTPATRASIIKVLLDRKYVRRKGKTLRATDKGRALIDAVPIDELKSPELTGRWEGRLSQVAEGSDPRDRFMTDVRGWVQQMVDALATAPLSDAAKRPREGSKPLGACPACGQPVRERGPVYSCDTGRSCPFVVFKKMAKRDISKRTVRQLLDEGRSKPLKGFKSRAGRPFEAGLVWNTEEQKVRFWFPDRKAPAPRRRRPTGPARPPVEGDRCPSCAIGTVIRGRTKLGCSRWREGCQWTHDG